MILTSPEKQFLDVFLHEATTSPFTGPATRALHAIGVEYGDISYLVWAYEKDVPRTSFETGCAAEAAPPVPWSNREAVRLRNEQIQDIREQQHEPAAHAGNG